MKDKYKGISTLMIVTDQFGNPLDQYDWKEVESKCGFFLSDVLYYSEYNDDDFSFKTIKDRVMIILDTGIKTIVVDNFDNFDRIMNEYEDRYSKFENLIKWN